MSHPALATAIPGAVLAVEAVVAGRVLAPAAGPPHYPLPELPMPPLPLPLPDSPEEGSGPAERRVWTAEEDEQIAALVAEHGTRSWSVISARLPTRTGKQCRERWHNHLVSAAQRERSNDRHGNAA